ncbi:nitroreductase/quinone reductase family protein [Streptomyces sp. ET3-23]|uniref:nitroreductase/quinone reductase family protein n=1 Tax=Streptomyces sp. ET3-23 TaxID=2885643 RepID=UPI0035AE3D5A
MLIKVTPRLRWAARALCHGQSLGRCGILRWADQNWPLLSWVARTHAALYRGSHGILGHCLPGLPPALLLDHYGARTGRRRTTPLLYGRDGLCFIVVASKGGHPENPAWFYNLLAHPDAVVQVGASRLRVRARVANLEQYEHLWEIMTDLYSGYEIYRRRTQRVIPIVILEPENP